MQKDPIILVSSLVLELYALYKQKPADIVEEFGGPLLFRPELPTLILLLDRCFTKTLLIIQYL